MVQTSPKHQENPLEYLIYRPLLQIMTNRPPCRYAPDDGAAVADVREDGLVWRRAGSDHRRPHPTLPPGLAQDAGHARLQELELQTKFYNNGEGPY